VDAVTDPDVVATVADALAAGRRVRLSYWVPARDEATERDVDPIRMFTSDGVPYFVGWCYRVDDVRTFRLDRALSVTLLDQAVDVPAEARQTAFDKGLFQPDDDDRLVTLDLDPSARWVADYHPVEDVTERGDGGVLVRLRARDDDWVRRLALGLAGRGRVTEPPDLAAQIRVAAAEALSAYRSIPGSD
jgi:proteasome accessory factor C